MSDRLDMFKVSGECERAFNWMYWAKLIPFIHWPQEVEVKAIPPGAAMIRYSVKLHGVDKEVAFVSVYLDCHSILGCVDAPYWEIYPAKGGDTDRFLLSEPVEEMVSAIVESLKWQAAENVKKEAE